MIRSLLSALAVGITSLAVAADPKQDTAIAAPAAKLTDLDGKSVAFADLRGKTATVVVFVVVRVPRVELLRRTPERPREGARREGRAPSSSCAPPTIRRRTSRRPRPASSWRCRCSSTRRRNSPPGLKAKTTPEAFVLDAEGVVRYRGRIDDAYSAPPQAQPDHLVARPERRPRRRARRQAGGSRGHLAGRLPDRSRARGRGQEWRGDLPQATSPRSSTPTASCATAPARSGRSRSRPTSRPAAGRTTSRSTPAIAQMPPWMPAARRRDARRAQADREGDRHPRGVGRRRHPRGRPEGCAPRAGLRRRLAARQAGPDPHPRRRLPARGPRRRPVPRLRRPHRADREQVGRRLRREAGQPARRPPHAALLRHHRPGAAAWRRSNWRRTSRLTAARSWPTAGRATPPAWASGSSPRAASATRPTFGGIGGWAPGQMPQFVPQGMGWLLPKGADFLIQTHYHRNGQPAPTARRSACTSPRTRSTSRGRRVIVNGMKPSEKIPAGKADHVSRGRGLPAHRRGAAQRPAAHAPARQADEGDDDAAGRQAGRARRHPRWDYKLAGDVLVQGADPREGGHEDRDRGGVRQLVRQPEQPDEPAQGRERRRADDRRDAVRLPRRNQSREAVDQGPRSAFPPQGLTNVPPPARGS